jgi:hypothetical protein
MPIAGALCVQCCLWDIPKLLIGERMMAKAKILPAPSPSNGYYGATTKNTGLDQRETLEEIMINLATSLGIQVIYKALTARFSYIYEVQSPSFSGFQSASNTILELSRAVAKKSSS